MRCADRLNNKKRPSVWQDAGLFPEQQTKDACAQADIPLIHGAVCGWCCQYGVSMPGSGLLHRIYSGAVPKDNGVLPFVPPFCAALQCTEAAKLLTGRQVSANKLYIYDLCSMDFEVINL